MTTTEMIISTAAIISTGTELLQGLYVDTNAHWLAAQLTSEGIEVNLIAAAPDRATELESLLRYACSRVDLIVCSGGLGPTADDINREVFARVFETSLVEDPHAVEMMRARFQRRGRVMPESNLIQARVPHNAIVLYNEWGTAPGFFIPPLPGTEGGKESRCRPALLALPGPPRELQPMFKERALPVLRSWLGPRRFVRTRTLHTFGAPESELGEYVRELFATTSEVSFTMLAKPHGVDIRIVARGKTEQEVAARLAELEAETRKRIPPRYIYGCDEDTLPSVTADLLIKKRLRLACAESCTGGLISKFLTDVPGVSACFLAGIVTYANEAKEKLLGVSAESLQCFGAVSEPVAREMATGALAVSDADIAVAVTGIAGPTGSTDEKPVGLTYIALATREAVSVQRYVFTGDREFNRTFAALTALNWIRLEAQKIPDPSAA